MEEVCSENLGWFRYSGAEQVCGVGQNAGKSVGEKEVNEIALAPQEDLPRAQFIFNKQTNTFESTYLPLPRQQLLHTTTARQVMWGGSVAGGKTHGIRWDAYLWCFECPGLRAYLFRRKRPELKRTHIDFISQEIPEKLARFSKTDNALYFFNGSILYFCYLDNEEDAQNYMGVEGHWIEIDEAVQFDPSNLELLRSRLRLGGFRPQNDPEKRLPRMVLATNPAGGAAHMWLKENFVDPSPPETVFYDKSTSIPDQGFPGLTSIFIPASIRDNPYVDQVQYPAQLQGLAPELKKALLEGSWDSLVGTALHNLSKDKHMIPNFRKEDNRNLWSHWLHFTSMDWGVAAPFCVLWYCVSDVDFELRDTKTGHITYIPESSVIVFDEWYGAREGTISEGLRLPATSVARQVLAKEQELHIRNDYRVCDYAAWASTDGGASVAEQMAKHGLQQRQAKKNRQAGYHEVLSRLSGNPKFMSEGNIVESFPTLYITENCKMFWKTVPPLVLDSTDPDKGPAKVNPRQADHEYDCLSYALMSQPFVITAEERYQRDAESFREAYLEAREDMDAGPVDPYAIG